MEQTYTIGGFLQSLINVVGFNLIDSSTALPEILTLFLLLTIGVIIWKAIKN